MSCSKEDGSVPELAVLPTQAVLDLVGNLLALFCDICILLALSGLENGIIIAQKTSLRSGTLAVPAGQAGLFDRIFHLSMCGLSAILAILSITAFALGQRLYNENGWGTSRIGYDHTFVGERYQAWSLGVASHMLISAVDIIILITALILLVKSIITKVRVKRDRRVTMAIYSVIYNSAVRHDGIPSPFYSTLDVLFDSWPEFIIFCILFALGCKKRGLWSTRQPPSPGLLEEASQHSERSLSHNISHRSEQSMDSPMQEPQMHEMLEVASPESQPATQVPQHQIPRRPVNPPQIQQQQQQIRQTLAVEEDDDDSPPDYYSVGHQPPPQHMLQSTGSLPSTVVDASQPQAGPSSYALPAQPAYEGDSPHTDETGLYHQADGMMRPSDPLPYNGVSVPGSPPPHADVMGLYHQADGMARPSAPLPYNEKSSAPQ
ncbi:hypothetical protein QQS21_004420 [Conoideocrella luteorostrata]|uniref:Uncharacterized protein n=1 Tax=Conoideocrella luteorostrata TaxID=1105319 RepID=A0AAJ0FVG4_9HYPO|nr:hypothetical protein QQS21_004420 [Conoideocrella luteorostrata]